MNSNTTDTGQDGRRLRTTIVTAIAVVAFVTAAAVPAKSATVVAILHPMQPIGNIDCCH